MELSSLKKDVEWASAYITKEKDNKKIHSVVEEVVTKATGAEYASIWVYDYICLTREREDGIKTISMDAKKGLLYQCFATKQVIMHNYLTSAKGYVAKIDNPDKIKIKSKIMVPLIVKETFIGIVTVYSSIAKKKLFTKSDLEVLQALKPLIIDAVFRINHNNNNPILVDRRTNPSNMSDYQRRKDDMIKQLEEIEVKSSQSVSSEKILEITSKIVHDIRTPANGLLGFLEILSEKIEDRRLKQYVEHAHKSASLIETLTTSILDGVSDKREPVLFAEKESIYARRFFAEIAGVFSANMYKKHIDYTIFIDPEVPKIIEIDTMKMKRVILNLIGNASKFTPENASILFSVLYDTDTKKLSVSVKDTGIGIAKEKQKDIFIAFKQAEENTKEKFGGTGLGLAICAAYVKDMGGELLLESELDKGSNFYFSITLEKIVESEYLHTLRETQSSIYILCEQSNISIVRMVVKYLIKFGLNKEKIKAVTNMSKISQDVSHVIVFENKLTDDFLHFAKETNLKYLIVEENFLSINIEDYSHAIIVSQYGYYGDILYSFVNDLHLPKVLVVDDDKISIMLLMAMLEDEQCEIDVAHDGEEGKKMLIDALRQNHPYDIVYTDEHMPKLSGIEMLRTYREEESKRKVSSCLKAVSISGDCKKSIDGDGFDFLATKPFNKKEIISILQDIIH